MNEENENNVQTPDFEGEKMKMPENSDLPPTNPTEGSSVISGPLLVGLAIVLVLILGAMYFWFSSLTIKPAPLPPTETPTERPTAEENNEPESTTAEAQTDMMGVTSPSDEIDAIEADIEATDLDSLDEELEAIDAEFDAALGEQ